MLLVITVHACIHLGETTKYICDPLRGVPSVCKSQRRIAQFHWEVVTATCALPLQFPQTSKRLEGCSLGSGHETMNLRPQSVAACHRSSPAGETRLRACSLHSAAQQTSYQVRRVPLTRRFVHHLWPSHGVAALLLGLRSRPSASSPYLVFVSRRLIVRPTRIHEPWTVALANHFTGKAMRLQKRRKVRQMS